MGDIGGLVVGADVDGPLVGGAVADSVVGRTVGGVVESTKAPQYDDLCSAEAILLGKIIVCELALANVKFN